MLHPANLVHLVLFVSYWLALSYLTKRKDVRLIHAIANLIQATFLCLVIDIAIGFFLVAHVFGDSPSAMWIYRSVTVMPVLLILSFWRLRVARRRMREGS